LRVRELQNTFGFEPCQFSSEHTNIVGALLSFGAG